jgi:hypothetical protein
MSNSNIIVPKLELKDLEEIEEVVIRFEDLKEAEEIVIGLRDKLRSLEELMKLSNTIKNLQVKKLEEELIRKDTLILDRDCKIEKLTYENNQLKKSISN